MNVAPPDGEIRTSTVRALLDKVRKQNYERYLVSLRLERLRLFKGATITFEFPVTALVGPNGGGKTTVLSAAACIYANSEPERIFPRSRIGDDQTQVWHVEYDVIDKSTLPQGTLRGRLQCLDSKWKNTSSIQRDVTLLSLARTLPLAEQPRFDLRAKLTGRGKNNRVTTFETIELPSAATDRIRREAEKILGKSLKEYRFFGVTATTTKMRRVRKKALRVDDQPGDWTPTGRVHTSKQTLFVGKNEISEFSEFNFGAGESSVLRIVAEIEFYK